MGILYSVFPIEKQAAEWLESLDVQFDPAAPSRLPTGREVEDVVTHLAGYRAKISNSGIGGCWQALVEEELNPESEEWTLLNISKYRGPDVPNEIWFEKGSTELILKILQSLSQRTGTLVVYADCGGNPVVVTPGRSLEEMMESW